MLILCGTPIGNLEDISPRAARALGSADVIYAEDTRRTLKLLHHLGIQTSIRRYDEHSKQSAGDEIADRLTAGETVVLTTDAGMPGISDPGADLVRLCIERELEFEIVGGPTALIHAAVGSGLDVRRFAFEGFLPAKRQHAIDRLERIAGEDRTLIFYVSPHDLTETLGWMLETLGDRAACAARELTKRYEEFRRDTLSGLVSYYEANRPVGEFVVLVEGARACPVAVDEAMIREELESLARQGCGKKEAVSALAAKLPVKKSVIYRVAEESRFF